MKVIGIEWEEGPVFLTEDGKRWVPRPNASGGFHWEPDYSVKAVEEADRKVMIQELETMLGI